jgi:hypothetical protein
MDDIIQELQDHFTFILVVDFRKLNKRVIPDPYPIPRARELNRIAKKKVYKTTLDHKYGFGAMGFYRYHSKFLAIITSSGVFIPSDWDLVAATVLPIRKGCPIMYMGI